jgi:hypothetical protein
LAVVELVDNVLPVMLVVVHHLHLHLPVTLIQRMVAHLSLMQSQYLVAAKVASIATVLVDQVDRVAVAVHMLGLAEVQLQPDLSFTEMLAALLVELVAVEAVVQVKLEQLVVPEMVEMELHQQLQER